MKIKSWSCLVMVLMFSLALFACGGGGGGKTPKYTVTYDGNGQTTGTVPVDGNKYKDGEAVTVLDNSGGLAKTNDSLIGWNTAADGSGTTYKPGQTFTMGTSDVTLYATWVQTITEFTIPTSGSAPYGITSGPDGNLWFTEENGHKIGRITTGGTITEFSSGLTANSEPVGITAGPDNNLWFAEFNDSKIGQIATGGTITEFSSGLTAGGTPLGIVAGPDGNLWFTELNGNRIGQITTGGNYYRVQLRPYG
jgi:streptogramin lyase